MVPHLPRSNRGITLLEVLVAFVVLTLVTGVAMQIFSSSAQVTSRIANAERAAALAESKLAVLSAGLRQPGEWGGEWNRYAWQADAVDVTPEEFSKKRSLLRLYRLTVSISWRERGWERSHTLTTLRVVSPTPR